MYFPIGWPKVIKIPDLGQSSIRHITCNRDRILFAVVTDDSLAIWFYKPCVPIVFQRRSTESIEKFGTNVIAEWKPDSSMIVIATSEGHLLYYKIGVPSDHKGLYNQTDSPNANLRRDSAELFIKETIPPLTLTLSDEIMVWDGRITGMVCITMMEVMLSTTNGHVLRYRWDGSQNRDYTLDLRRIPFCINQQVSKAIPIVEENTYIIEIEYSPLVGGFSIVLNDGRAAFLTASSLKFDPNQVQGIWAQGIEDATSTTINHKYRLITFGRANSECVVYCVDESTGGLEISHNCVLSSKDYPGCPGTVSKSHQCHLYLQGEDKLYVNSANTLIRAFSERSKKDDSFGENPGSFSTTHAEGRQWLVIPIPSTYSSTNWPTRYSAIDADGANVAVAGRTGLAHYSMLSRRWKLFGNETQEKDFIVAGGLLWWRDYLVMGCYSILDGGEELRFYPKEAKLDNRFAKIVRVAAPILLMNVHHDQLITFGSDAQVCIWQMRQNDSVGDVDLTKLQVVDISALAVHPACIASITLTSLRTETGRGHHNVSESMVLNVSGRLLLVQREVRSGEKYTCLMPTVLASCVENVWVPVQRRLDKVHTFMSKRIMLPFHLRIYPLAILFEDAILLGAENDTVLYTSDSSSPFSLPLSVLQRTSQVYLHQILRQLIRRNLGFHAWEIARSCMGLPYFPHSLELLLHEVLEEEATSKEPIPDAQLPSIIEFIMEFPVYLETVVQCARKTEIALWPYLFSAAGKPKDLFQECMAKGQLDTAASYLIILQNLETSSLSRQYATLLLNTALDKSKWELAKDLVRFLRAIDPNDVESESPRTSFILPPKLGIPQPPPAVSPNAEDLSLILGNVQGPRVRSYSTTVSPKLVERSNSMVSNIGTVVESPVPDRKKSVPNSVGNVKSDSRAPSNNNNPEETFIDVILQKHARRLLSVRRLTDLGYFAAHLDFHLVSWLGKERDRASRVDDFVKAFKQVHEDFNWPYPTPSLAVSRKSISSSQSPLESPTAHIEDQLRSLKVDVYNYHTSSSMVGDSGYMSFQDLPCTGLITPANTLEQSSRMADTEMGEHGTNKIDLIERDLFDRKASGALTPGLQLGLKTTTLASVADESVMSAVSSVWGDDRDLSVTGTDNWEIPSAQILEQLSTADSKGSPRAEVQLRYLLQLFMEAGCLEWSLLLSVLLRDAMAVVRTVNAAKSHDQSIEAVSRLRQGLIILNYWTSTECLGYKAFMLAIQNQISVLTRILETKIQHHQIVEYQQALSATLNKVTPKQPRSRKTSSNHEGGNQPTATVEKGKLVSSNGSHHSNEASSEGNTGTLQESIDRNVTDNPLIPESTGCVVS
nr:guanine nucleotide exchange factor subunit Rich [Leptinotarsa decemlineata]